MMKISEHDVSKVCTPQDEEKYIPIVNAKFGKQKIICYVAKFLKDNNISTFYPNICVAVWIMFPKIESFYLKPFEDFPDTDNIARWINLHSRPKEQNYMIGGNPEGSGTNNPFILTPKGMGWAQEVEMVLTGKKPAPIVSAPSRTSAKKRKSSYYVDIFKRFTRSTLFSKYCDGDEIDDDIPKRLLCGTLGAYYPQTGTKTPYHDMRRSYIKKFRNKLEEAKKDGVLDEILTELDVTSDQFLGFLKVLEGRKIV